MKQDFLRRRGENFIEVATINLEKLSRNRRRSSVLRRCSIRERVSQRSHERADQSDGNFFIISPFCVGGFHYVDPARAHGSQALRRILL